MVQHGIFYSTVQALLFVFCYRYEELNKEENSLSQFNLWNLDKIVFNSLNPLQHISQGVALCFLNLARRFNLFEKNTDNSSLSPKTSTHSMAEISLKRRRAVIDLFFPFSFCSLKICSPLIFPLMRRFTPLEKLCKNVIIDEDEEDIDEEVEQQNNCIEENERENILPIDEGYEEELMCLQSVNEFNNFNNNIILKVIMKNNKKWKFKKRFNWEWYLIKSRENNLNILQKLIAIEGQMIFK
uniref:Uncharacterized protein n=1 Tax=Meloidogyne enterolobii TaxID=390850 RepID=A0A6V7TH40_MELEN|nr:unnamed protein product [Meloidogyne enterolobii]